MERLGGFAGFGPGSHLRSTGEVDLADLVEADRAAVTQLFDHPAAAAAPQPDAFRYRLTRTVDGKSQTVEVPEAAVPEAIRDKVHDELR